MIYLDNASTTWPKPLNTAKTVADIIINKGANPGRSGYAMAEEASELVYKCRCHVASFFGSNNPENVIFTPSCTHSINYVLKGVLRPGDHVIISNLEHNAVSRPIRQLAKAGVYFSTAKVHEGDTEATLREFRRAIRRNTKMIFCTHASNAFGIRLPIYEIGELSKQYGLLFGVDCAQSGGTADIDLQRLKADYICLPAHKGLYGIMGLGILLINNNIKLETIIEGGTGSMSAVNFQPEMLPDRFESGTLNLPAIGALDAGLSFIEEIGRAELEQHEFELMQTAYNALCDNPRCLLYTSIPKIETHVPLISFNLKDVNTDSAGSQLGKLGIATRCGLHCAGEAHRALNTEQTGTIRICPSAFTDLSEIQLFINALDKVR